MVKNPKSDASSCDISFLVCNYNDNEVLTRCISSLKHQKSAYSQEIIVIDDASTPRCYDYPKVKVVHLLYNVGLSRASNVALSLAKGKYVVFVDADDIIYDNFADRVVSTMERLQLDILQFSCSCVDEAEHDLPDEPYYQFSWLPKSADFPTVYKWSDVATFAPQFCVTRPLNAYRREFLALNNIFFPDTRICYEDTPFFTSALLKAERVSYLDERLLAHTIRPTGISANLARNFGDYIKAIRVYTLPFVKKNTNFFVYRLFAEHFCKKVYKVATTLPISDQKRYLHDIFGLLAPHYAILPVDLRTFCAVYAREKHQYLCTWHIPDKVEFKISFQFRPILNISFFGLPILQTRTRPGCVTLRYYLFGFLPVWVRKVGKFNGLLTKEVK